MGGALVAVAVVALQGPRIANAATGQVWPLINWGRFDPGIYYVTFPEWIAFFALFAAAFVVIAWGRKNININDKPADEDELS